MTEAVMEPAQTQLKQFSQPCNAPKCSQFGDFFGCENPEGCEAHQDCLRAWSQQTDLTLTD